MLQQHHYRGEQLDPNLCALDHIKRLPQDESSAVGLHDPGTRQEETSQRSYLSNFGIRGGRAMIPVRYLSGGQRMRVALSVALFRRPDLLILDEPTNHLDSDTVRALCEALETFEGAIIAVSHDEAFVNRVIATAVTGDKASVNAGTALSGELWVMSKKKVQRFDGSFRDYKKAIRKVVLSGEDHKDV
jgi:ATPase subunit of ABC transporter with duplicated ATPase domains